MKCAGIVVFRTRGRKYGRWMTRKCQAHALKGDTLCVKHREQEQRHKRGE